MFKTLTSAAIAILALSVAPIAASAAHPRYHHHMRPMMVMVNGHMTPLMVMVNGHMEPVMVEDNSANGS